MDAPGDGACTQGCRHEVDGEAYCGAPAAYVLRYEPRLTGLPAGAPLPLCRAHAERRRSRQDRYGVWVIVSARRAGWAARAGAQGHAKARSREGEPGGDHAQYPLRAFAPSRAPSHPVHQAERA